MAAMTIPAIAMIRVRNPSLFFSSMEPSSYELHI
jgi:hypothetical protein